MKKRFNKIVSLICTLALLVSMCSFVTVFASGEVRIITAQFMPYEGQIKVLASLADGYTNAKVYVNGTEIATTSATQADGDVVFTSTSFTPAAYGVATVKLQANVGGVTISDTQNVKIYKVTSKTLALSENFDQLDAATMENVSDSSVSNLLKTSKVTAVNFPDNIHSATADIVQGYNGFSDDNKSLVFKLPSLQTAKLTGIQLYPTSAKTGLVDLSFDMYSTNIKSRLSMYIYGVTGRYIFQSELYPRSSYDSVNNSWRHSSAYYIKHHDYNTYSFSDHAFEANQWNRIRFVMNLDESKYEVYVNEEMLDYGILTDALSNTVATGFARLQFQIAGATGTQVALDNIVMNYIGYDPHSFSKESDITELDEFINGANESIDNVTLQNKAEVETALFSHESHDGLGIRWKNTQEYVNSKKAPALFIQDTFGIVTTGRIVLEHDFCTSDGSGTFNYGLSCKIDGTSYNFYPLGDTSLISGGKVGSKTVTYADNKWHKVKIVVDFMEKVTEVYIDNVFIDSGVLLTNASTAATRVEVPGYQQIRITYSPGSAYKPAVGEWTTAFAIDNWRVYKELPLAEPTNVTKYDISGNSAALVRTDVVPADSTDKFEIALTNTEYLNQASLEANVKVLADGAQVQDAVSLSDGTLTIDVSDVPAHAELELVIGKDTLLYDGITTIGADTMFNLKSANENGLYIKRAVDSSDTVLRADCDFDIVSGLEKNLVAVFASYNDNDELVGITTRTVEELSGAKSLSMTLPKADATKVKVFVWDALASSVTPYETELIYSIPSQN